MPLTFTDLNTMTRPVTSLKKPRTEGSWWCGITREQLAKEIRDRQATRREQATEGELRKHAGIPISVVYRGTGLPR